MDKYADMTLSEFTSKYKNENFEIYTEAQVKQFSSDLLKSQDPEEIKNGTIDFVSLNRVVVVDDDLNKSVMFWRPAQIEWKEDDISKSKTGYYKDTPENRKKGIVGKPYGDVKANQWEEAPKSAVLSKLKQEYAASLKAGNKKEAEKIGKKIALLSKKEKTDREPDKKEG